MEVGADVAFYIRTLHGSTAPSVAVVPCRIFARLFLSRGSHGCNFLLLCLPGLAHVCPAEVPHGAMVVPRLRIYHALLVLLLPGLASTVLTVVPQSTTVVPHASAVVSRLWSGSSVGRGLSGG